MKKIIATMMLLVVAFMTSAIAQQTDDRRRPSIRTNGEATITVQPDRVRIDIGVVTQSATSQAAVSENARKLEATLARLKQLLGTTAEIRTISYTVTPNYRYPREGGEPTITGYTATNTVRVTFDDLTKVGSVIDTATQAGANRIQALQFTVKNEEEVKAQALREAALAARKKAEALAGALGASLGRVLFAEESGPVAIPVRDVSFARAESTQTPIEPGMIEVRASVVLTIEILN